MNPLINYFMDPSLTDPSSSLLMQQMGGAAPAQPPAQPDFLTKLHAAMQLPPVARALLSGGAALMQAGGPSDRPVGLGQALGSSLNASTNAYDTTLNQQMQRQGMQQRLADNQWHVLTPQEVAAKQLTPAAPGFNWMGNANGDVKTVGNGQSTSSAEQWRPMTQQDKAKYGIDPNDPNSWMVSSSGDVKVAGGASYGSNPADVEQAQAIAEAIATGKQPPDMHGLYRFAGPVKAALAKSGYDLTKANQDWTATQKLLSTLNGAQQTRLRQAINQVDESLPLVDSLAQQWNGGNFPILNKVNLVAAKNGVYGPQAQSIATQLDAEIADVASELGTVYKGGNSSTDESLKLAAQQLNSSWSLKTLQDAVDLARKNIQYRKNSLNLATAGIPQSQYNQVAPNAGAQAGNSPAAPANNDPLGIR